MKDTKLTVRVPSHLLDNFKRYAARHGTTQSALIEAYLRWFPSQDELEDAPIVKRLSGILSQEVTIQDYREYLEDKYD
jgi:hypothetical protein